MKIIEQDFKIEHDGFCFVLYFKKTKKELKEKSKEELEEELDKADEIINPFKIHGYYSVLKNALYQVLKWRKDSKYPFKESSFEFEKTYKLFIKAENKLNNYSNFIFDSITDLENLIFYEHRRFLDRNQE